MSQLKYKIYWILGFIILIWAVEFVNQFMGHSLSRWGVYPRRISSLIGIPLSPFLHYGIGHVLLNTFPFIVLGGLVIIQGVRLFFWLSLFIILFSGISVWLFGRPSFHVGASGLIFGYFGFLVAFGWYGKSISSIIIAFVSVFMYGGILWGVLPTLRHVSWEGHLFGLVAGILGAYLLKTRLHGI